MNYRSYYSILSRRRIRDKMSERAILASGICALISSSFANMVVSQNFGFRQFLLVLAFIIAYLLLYCLFGKGFEFLMNNPKYNKRFSKGIYREDVMYIIGEEMPSDLKKLIHALREESTLDEEKQILMVKACYEISQMLTFLEHFKGVPYFTNTARKAPAFASYDSIKAILDSILKVLDLCEPLSDANKLRTQEKEIRASILILKQRLFQILCKPPNWCRIRAPEWRLTIWQRRTEGNEVRRKQPDGKRYGNCLE